MAKKPSKKTVKQLKLLRSRASYAKTYRKEHDLVQMNCTVPRTLRKKINTYLDSKDLSLAGFMHEAIRIVTTPRDVD